MIYSNLKPACWELELSDIQNYELHYNLCPLTRILARSLQSWPI